MLYRLGLYLLEKEYEFMNREGEGLVALSMRRVADAIGVHETTISRIVNLKVVANPVRRISTTHVFWFVA